MRKYFFRSYKILVFNIKQKQKNISDKMKGRLIYFTVAMWRRNWGGLHPNIFINTEAVNFLKHLKVIFNRQPPDIDFGTK